MMKPNKEDLIEALGYAVLLILVTGYLALHLEWGDALEEALFTETYPAPLIELTTAGRKCRAWSIEDEDFVGTPGKFWLCADGTQLFDPTGVKMP